MSRLKFPISNRFNVRPGSGSLHLEVKNGSGKKAFIAVFEYLTAAGNLINGPYPKLSYSSIGAFRYFDGCADGKTLSVQVQLIVPREAAVLIVTIASWKYQEAVLLGEAPRISGQIAVAGPVAAAPVAAAPASATPLSQTQTGKREGCVIIAEEVIMPERLYTISIKSRSVGEKLDKAAILLFDFLDAKGQFIPGRYPGLDYSETVGNYRYVNSRAVGDDTETKLALVPPQSATMLLIQGKRWRSKHQPSISGVTIEVGLQYAGQIQAVKYAVEAALSTSDTSIRGTVLITATTRSLDISNRLNRPQIIAREFAKAGFLVFYVYYRFDKSEQLPSTVFANIVQIPVDMFETLAPSIAEQAPFLPRIMLLSIPDDRSVRQLGLFKRYSWRIIYEVRDDWEEFAAANVGKWYRPLWERFLCSAADWVITVSPALRRKMILLSADPERCIINPNATTEEFVAAAQPYRVGRSSPSRQIDTPVFGYFGHLTEAWFDWPLLLTAARLRPEWRFECIGFGAPSNLDLPSNVIILDAVPQLNLPELSKHWDVGLIPFKLGALSLAVDPIKVYDYISLGLPTLSVPMGQIETYCGVSIYRGIADFLEKADLIVRRLQAQDLVVAVDPATITWGSRIRSIIDLSPTVR